jgi:hypothetical protein
VVKDADRGSFPRIPDGERILFLNPLILSFFFLYFVDSSEHPISSSRKKIIHADCSILLND